MLVLVFGKQVQKEVEGVRELTGGRVGEFFELRDDFL